MAVAVDSELLPDGSACPLAQLRSARRCWRLPVSAWNRYYHSSTFSLLMSFVWRRTLRRLPAALSFAATLRSALRDVSQDTEYSSSVQNTNAREEVGARFVTFRMRIHSGCVR